MSDHIIHLKDGVPAEDTTTAEIERIVANAATKKGIVFHFHGGLVNRALGTEIAQRLEPLYRAAGVYPIFFVWEAGLLEALRNRVTRIAAESLFQRLWQRLAEFAERKLAQHPAARAAGDVPALTNNRAADSIRPALDPADSAKLVAPARVDTATALSPVEALRLQAELETDPVLATQLARLAFAARAEGARGAAPAGPPTETLMDDAVLAELGASAEPGRRGVLSTVKLAQMSIAALARTLLRFRAGRDHGFHATIVEELLRTFYLANVGRGAWDLLKSNTAAAFAELQRGGSTVLDCLAKHLPADPSRVTLIGHSTGAIYISEFIEHAVQVLPPELKFEVIFLAAASTVVRTTETLRKHAGRISAFRAFAMLDENEKKDELVPVVYPHSLLYFVSGVLEEDADEPIVGMERFFTKPQYHDAEFPFVAELREYMGVQGRALWSVTNAIAGQRTASLTHGDFDNDTSTLESLQHILAKGF